MPETVTRIRAKPALMPETYRIRTEPTLVPETYRIKDRAGPDA